MSDTASQLRDRLAALSGDYLIERELGQGGMATVYLAHDVRHERKVALKVLRPELAAVIGATRFLQEIRTIANLQHPHILPLFDSGDVNGTVFYVMPYVEGESLRDRLQRERQLPLDDVVHITSEVASALDYAHRRGILHRDIKPENILLHEGKALVADFGIALAVARSEGAPRLTETGMSLGTPHYMSPEQAMGERTLDARTDIYSLGCVVYEMLAGEPPFTGPSAQAIIARVVTEQPRALHAQRRTIPLQMEAAVLCALEKLPADRFATAGQFAEALVSRDSGALRTSHAARSFPTSMVARGARGELRRWLPWAAAALGIATAAFVLWRTGERPAEPTWHRIAVWDGPVRVGALGFELALSPDGTTMVYMDTVGGTRQLWLKDRHSAEVLPLAGTQDGVMPVFSPDGQWVAFVADGKLRKVPRAGGPPMTLADSVNWRLPALAWLEGGTILFADLGFNLVAINQDGGAKRRVFAANPRSRGVSAITPLPGGRAALVATCTFGCPDVDLRSIDLQTGESRILAADVVKGWYLPGDRVVFVRRDGAVFVARFDLRRLEFRGSPVPVMEGVRTAFGAPDMVVAANGTAIYVSGRGEASGLLYSPVWVTRDGHSTPVDPAWSFTPAGNGGVAVSPDGRRLAVAARLGGSEDLWVKDVAGGPVMRLTFGGFNIRPEWSADGSAIFYVSTPSEGDAIIRMRRSDGTGSEETLLDLERPVFEIARTPDPSVFLIRLGGPPSRDIMLWRRGVADSVLPLIAAPGFDEIAPALSPDGRWLAYVSNETGRNEVFVRPFPNVEAGRWQVSRSGGSEVLWSRNGRELYYREPAGDLIAVSIGAGDAFQMAAQRVLFSANPFRQGASRHESYDVAPDGRFVFKREVSRQGGDEPAPLILVDNWLVAIEQAERRR